MTAALAVLTGAMNNKVCEVVDKALMAFRHFANTFFSTTSSKNISFNYKLNFPSNLDEFVSTAISIFVPFDLSRSNVIKYVLTQSAAKTEHPIDIAARYLLLFAISYHEILTVACSRPFKSECKQSFHTGCSSIASISSVANS